MKRVEKENSPISKWINEHEIQQNKSFVFHLFSIWKELFFSFAMKFFLYTVIVIIYWIRSQTTAVNIFHFFFFFKLKSNNFTFFLHSIQCCLWMIVRTFLSSIAVGIHIFIFVTVMLQFWIHFTFNRIFFHQQWFQESCTHQTNGRHCMRLQCRQLKWETKIF